MEIVLQSRSDFPVKLKLSSGSDHYCFVQNPIVQLSFPLCDLQTMVTSRGSPVEAGDQSAISGAPGPPFKESERWCLDLLLNHLAWQSPLWEKG